LNGLIPRGMLKSSFVKRVGVLVGGTAIAQLVAISALPILTRLYTPESFSALAVYSSVLAMLSVVACLRFEIAIPLPHSDRTAASLCVLSMFSVIITSLIVGLFVIVIPEVFNFVTGNKISQHLWLIPLGVLAVGMYNALQYWCTRKKKFGLISKTRITQSISGTSVKVGVGYFLNGMPAGLLIGQLIAGGMGSFSLGIHLLKHDWQLFKSLKLNYLKAAFKRFDKFPKYSTLEAFANAGSIQIPIILIAYYAVGAEAGYLMIAMQLLSAPMGLIGAAVAQVYLSEGAEQFNKNELKQFTYKTILNLAKVAFLPLLLIALASPIFIPYVLGEQWQRTGVLITWMAPWFFMQFITSPVSMSLHITGKQKIAFVLQLTGLVLRIGGVILAILINERYIGEFYALSGFVFYSVYLIVVLGIVSIADRERRLRYNATL